MFVMSWLRFAITTLCRIGFFLGGVATAAMMLHIGADAVARTFFDSPLVGTLEVVSTWYMVALIFLPLGYLQGHRSHLIVELFTQNAPLRVQHALDFAMHTLASVFLAVWTIPAVQLALKKTAIHESMDAVFVEIVVWPTRWFMAVGMGLTCLAFALTALEHLGCAIKGTPLNADDEQDFITKEHMP
jgi:TRAP-type C4-dicarboxylate transport system permease small subunit